MAVTPESLYNKFPTDLLLDISEKTGIHYEKRRPSKQLQVETLAQKAANEGLSQIIAMLKKTQLDDLSATLDTENLATNGNNPRNHKVIAKRLKETIGNKSFGAYLEENDVSVATLKGILASAGSSCEVDTKEELIKQIELETGMLGLWAFFDKFSCDDLQYFAESLDLEVVSTKKSDLIACIIAQTDMPSGDAPKPKTAKPAIDEKITAKQLNAFYNSTVLARWLKQHGISETGTKAQLAQRIVDFHKGKDVPKAKPVQHRVAGRKEPSRLRKERNVVDRSTKEEKLVDAMSEEESDEDTRDEMRKNFAASESEEDSSISYEVDEDDYVKPKPAEAKKAAPKKAAPKKAAPKKVVEEEVEEADESEEVEEADESEEVEKAKKAAPKKAAPKKAAPKKAAPKKAAPKRAAKEESEESEESAELEESEGYKEGAEAEAEAEAEADVDAEADVSADVEESEENEAEKSYDIEGNVFFVYGNFGDLTQKNVAELIKKAGGTVCATVSAKCTKIVTANTDPENKYILLAQERDIEILGDDFIQFLQSNN